MILRTQTRPAHKLLDEALIEHDLTTRRGLSDYLKVHYVARHNLDYAFDATLNSEALTSIVNDLNTLGSKVPLLDYKKVKTDLHPLGLTYVIAGSSLGSKVLYKIWDSSSDQLVVKARDFMTKSKDSSEWDLFLAQTKSTDYSEQEIVSIVQAANFCFDVFKSANDLMIRCH